MTQNDVFHVSPAALSGWNTTPIAMPMTNGGTTSRVATNAAVWRGSVGCEASQPNAEHVQRTTPTSRSSNNTIWFRPLSSCSESNPAMYTTIADASAKAAETYTSTSDALLVSASSSNGCSSGSSCGVGLPFDR